jgi:hypothetical protein
VIADAGIQAGSNPGLTQFAAPGATGQHHGAQLIGNTEAGGVANR